MTQRGWQRFPGRDKPVHSHQRKAVCVKGSVGA
jgi:hypothetical protein